MQGEGNDLPLKMIKKGNDRGVNIDFQSVTLTKRSGAAGSDDDDGAGLLADGVADLEKIESLGDLEGNEVE
nr:hypothetical protein Itr_chr11CG16450 [Ipomoea trifida]